jgi:hypothetical protein
VGDHPGVVRAHSCGVLLGDLGLVALVPYWMAALGGGETVEAVIWNAFVHVVMVAGVFSLLVAPQLERWVNHHVMGG